MNESYILKQGISNQENALNDVLNDLRTNMLPPSQGPGYKVI